MLNEEYSNIISEITNQWMQNVVQILWNQIYQSKVTLKVKVFVRSMFAKVWELTLAYGFSKIYSKKANFSHWMKVIFIEKSGEVVWYELNVIILSFYFVAWLNYTF